MGRVGGAEMGRVRGAAMEHLKRGLMSQSHPPPGRRGRLSGTGCRTAGGLAPTAGTESRDGGLAWAEVRFPPSGGLLSVWSLQ